MSKPPYFHFFCGSGTSLSWPPQLGMVLQELMKLPAVSPEVLGSFEQAFSAKRSEKDQRNLIRKLLFNSGEGHAGDRSAIAQHVSGILAEASSRNAVLFFCHLHCFTGGVLGCVQSTQYT